jgi:predicted MPP superfamily phosphohydrolase
MNWLEIIPQIFEIVIFPLLAALTIYLVALIHTKRKQLQEKTKNETIVKYLEMLDKTITDCVIATNQTYVNSLKSQNKFDAEAQKEAFRLTYEAVLNILTEDAAMYLSEAIADLETYITSKIETEVVMSKALPNQ